MESIIRFLEEIESLKSTRRWCYTKEGIPESTAAHSFRLAIMVVLVGEQLKLPMAFIYKAVKMALWHDLPETYLTQDFTHKDIADGIISEADKEEQERQDMKKLLRHLPEDKAAEIYAEWQEYATGSSDEGRFVKGLDKLETTLQVIDTPPEYWDFEDPDTMDRTGLYGNAAIAKTSLIRSFALLIKEKLRRFYDKHGLKWRKSYDL